MLRYAPRDEDILALWNEGDPDRFVVEAINCGDRDSYLGDYLGGFMKRNPELINPIILALINWMNHLLSHPSILTKDHRHNHTFFGWISVACWHHPALSQYVADHFDQLYHLPLMYRWYTSRCRDMITYISAEVICDQPHQKELRRKLVTHFLDQDWLASDLFQLLFVENKLSTRRESEQTLQLITKRVRKLRHVVDHSNNANGIYRFHEKRMRSLWWMVMYHLGEPRGLRKVTKEEKEEYAALDARAKRWLAAQNANLPLRHHSTKQRVAY